MCMSRTSTSSSCFSSYRTLIADPFNRGIPSVLLMHNNNTAKIQQQKVKPCQLDKNATQSTMRQQRVRKWVQWAPKEYVCMSPCVWVYDWMFYRKTENVNIKRQQKQNKSQWQCMIQTNIHTNILMHVLISMHVCPSTHTYMYVWLCMTVTLGWLVGMDVCMYIWMFIHSCA